LTGSPGLEALIEIWDVPSGVLEVVATLRAREIGLPRVGDAEDDGWNWQLAPDSKPEQESVTVPVNELNAETTSETGALVFPGTTLTLAGDGAPKLKSTICNVSATSWVTLAESVPTA
jgi:hypothetical protein